MTRMYEMTEEQYQRVLAASRSVPYMVFGGHEPTNPRVRIEDAWRAVAHEHGCDWLTIEPAVGHGDRFFCAEPTAPVVVDSHG